MHWERKRDDSIGSHVSPYYFLPLTKVSIIVTADGYMEYKWAGEVDAVSLHTLTRRLVSALPIFFSFYNYFCPQERVTQNNY